ncbi:helicase [Limnochorda pilosa]|uniref:Helicase n=2 Tax=Limnochorda pilosa TaxID=1555112 RepID=A0A0K2SJ51_LIMPI|nr:helicase [Limnochorda pilosa]
MEPTTYRGFALDPFQQEAIAHIDRGDSVLVAAPTGTGKTLIADYLIERMHRQGRRVVYTAPIKALSNQKFKEFKRLLGEESVGILTGDVVVNPEAPILIMTTEVFRNLLHQDPARVEDVSYCIFDEIHYIDDPERGSVWEESLIFMPPHMRLLGLSATIPNVEELATWTSQVHGHPVRVVYQGERAVPLEHHLFERSLGFTTRDTLERRYRRYLHRAGLKFSDRARLPFRFEPTTHLDLLENLPPGLFPVLFFTFSRRKCELNALELARTGKAYLGPGEQQEVDDVIQEALETRVPSDGTRKGSVGAQRLRSMRTLLLKGIAYHHAGLLPVVKDVVEELFERRLIRVLYCTETFAVGINFPCRSVCFDSYSKWDGRSFRSLLNREYFQMAGRAGRRGIDAQGDVVTLVDFNYYVPQELPSMDEKDVEAIRSRFALSYNTVLNLVEGYDQDEVARILSKSFATFQAGQERREHEARLRQLEAERLRIQGCAYMETDRCPITLMERVAALEEKRREVASRLAQGKHRGVKRLRKEIREEEAALQALGVAGCPTSVVDRCRDLLPAYRRLGKRVDQLRERLAHLPSPERFLESYRQKRALLEALDYVRDGQLTARGFFASKINIQELLVTELHFDGWLHELEPDALNALAVSIDYEPRRTERRLRHHVFETARVEATVQFLQEMERSFGQEPTVRFHDYLALLAYHWSAGETFAEILRRGDFDEGDVVYAFRRAIDLLRQVRHAVRDDPYLSTKLQTCIDRMDRDEVAVVL